MILVTATSFMHRRTQTSQSIVHRVSPLTSIHSADTSHNAAPPPALGGLRQRSTLRLRVTTLKAFSPRAASRGAVRSTAAPQSRRELSDHCRRDASSQRFTSQETHGGQPPHAMRPRDHRKTGAWGNSREVSSGPDPTWLQNHASLSGEMHDSLHMTSPADMATYSCLCHFYTKKTTILLFLCMLNPS